MKAARLVVVAAAALGAGCGQAQGDRCQRFVERSRRVLEPMLAEAGKPSPPDLFAGMLDGCRAASADERAAIDCVVDAPDQAAVAACWQAEFADYAGTGVLRELRTKLGRVRRRAELELELRPDAAPIDAAPPVDARPARTWPAAVDVAALPQLVAPGLDPGAPAPVELVVVDLPAGLVWTVLRPDRAPLLTAPDERRISARVRARDRAGAYALLAAHLGEAPPAWRPRGGGPAVDLRFAAAPVADLLRLVADVQRRSIVPAPGPLGAVDIVARRVPVGAVLAGLLAVTGRRGLEVGNTTYVVPADLAALPALPAVPAAAGGRLARLTLIGAHAADAVAALRAISPAELGVRLPCGGPTFDLRLREVSPAEAVRALSVASGLPVEVGPAAPCEPPVGAPTDPTALHVVVWRGAERAAVVSDGQGKRHVVRPSTAPPVVEVLEYAVTYPDRTVAGAPAATRSRIAGDASDDAHLVRAAGVLIEAGAGRAWLQYDDGEVVVAQAGVGYDGRAVEVTPTGVTITEDVVEVMAPSDPRLRAGSGLVTFTVPLARAPAAP
ncbi:MAG: hypothetical protein KA190_20500 [Kofleriaceae bacterium]|nr:hypothetical protein [Kofleriaceae bacterium]